MTVHTLGFTEQIIRTWTANIQIDGSALNSNDSCGNAHAFR